MDDIVSTIVANGIWALLFCGLLFYELRDSSKREARYTETIRSLSDRMRAIDAVRTDTSGILSDTAVLKSDTSVTRAEVADIRSDVKSIKKSVCRRTRGEADGGAPCPGQA